MKIVCNKCSWEKEGDNYDNLLYELYKHNVETHNMPRKVKIKARSSS